MEAEGQLMGCLEGWWSTMTIIWGWFVTLEGSPRRKSASSQEEGLYESPPSLKVGRRYRSAPGICPVNYNILVLTLFQSPDSKGDKGRVLGLPLGAPSP